MKKIFLLSIIIIILQTTFLTAMGNIFGSYGNFSFPPKNKKIGKIIIYQINDLRSENINYFNYFSFPKNDVKIVFDNKKLHWKFLGITAAKYQYHDQIYTVPLNQTIYNLVDDALNYSGFEVVNESEQNGKIPLLKVDVIKYFYGSDPLRPNLVIKLRYTLLSPDKKTELFKKDLFFADLRQNQNKIKVIRLVLANNIIALKSIDIFKTQEFIDIALGNKQTTVFEIKSLMNQEKKLKNIPSDIDEIDTIKGIDFSYNSIRILDNLENYSSLEYLNMSHNPFKKINPSTIEGLKKLKVLIFQGTGLKKIGWLNILTNLIKLDCHSNYINNIGNINNLTNLKTLNLSRNRIHEISNLTDLINLINLNLSVNSIKNISGLQTQTKLKILNLSNNKISSVDGLDDLNNLTTLFLQKNYIKKISGLNNLKALETLYLNTNLIKKIEGLDSLENLFYLDLSGNKITTIEGLDKLKNLRWLDLSNNDIEKIENLDALVNLRVLNLSFNNFDNIKELSKLTNLRELYLASWYIKDLTGIGNLTNLERLELGLGRFDKLGEITSLTKLKELSLAFSKIDTLEGIEKLVNLESLNLEQTPIVHLSNLENLSKLKYLRIPLGIKSISAATYKYLKEKNFTFTKSYSLIGSSLVHKDIDLDEYIKTHKIEIK